MIYYAIRYGNTYWSTTACHFYGFGPDCLYPTRTQAEDMLRILSEHYTGLTVEPFKIISMWGN